MGNTDEPFAFLDIRSMNGIEHKMNNDVCVEMTKIMEDVLGVTPCVSIWYSPGCPKLAGA